MDENLCTKTPKQWGELTVNEQVERLRALYVDMEHSLRYHRDEVNRLRQENRRLSALISRHTHGMRDDGTLSEAGVVLSLDDSLLEPDRAPQDICAKEFRPVTFI